MLRCIPWPTALDLVAHSLLNSAVRCSQTCIEPRQTVHQGGSKRTGHGMMPSGARGDNPWPGRCHRSRCRRRSSPGSTNDGHARTAATLAEAAWARRGTNTGATRLVTPEVQESPDHRHDHVHSGAQRTGAAEERSNTTRYTEPRDRNGYGSLSLSLSLSLSRAFALCFAICFGRDTDLKASSRSQEKSGKE